MQLSITAAVRSAEPSRVANADAQRVTRGLSVAYDFYDIQDGIVRDRGKLGTPINLKIEESDAVRIDAGEISILGPSSIVSMEPATRLSTAIQRSGELTIEAWVKSSDDEQTGPARIVTLSKNATNRNFTLGQAEKKFDFRLRSSKTSDNGIPSFATRKERVSIDEMAHVVVTRSRNGGTTYFIDGVEQEQKKIEGSLAGWSTNYRLSLANELGGGRPWLGTIRLVAIYHRCLSPKEVMQNFIAGSNVRIERPSTAAVEDRFATSVAPMLADHCLECHDSATRKGGLDLSRRLRALAGGDSGVALVPGNASASLLYQSIEANDMPANRPPLSEKQKKVLRDWIDGGAKWSMDFVDPVLFLQSGGGDRDGSRWVRRLTREEYIASVQATVGVDISDEADQLLPADLRADGFSNTAYNLNVDLAHVEAYAQLAETVVNQVDIRQFARRFGKNRKFTDKDMGALIESMGKWVLRGPLEEHEVIALRGISTTVASSGGSHDEAMRLILQAMLQSPRFIYRIENQAGDGTRWPIDAYQLATRLSFLIWGAPPDEELFRAAETGDLFDPVVFDRQLDRMLADSRAGEQAVRFAQEWLHLTRLENLRPNGSKFPGWNQQLAADMQRETSAFFYQVAWVEDRPMAALLDAQVTFATDQLANHYRLQVDQGSPTQLQLAGHDWADLRSYDLGEDTSRGGILTHGSILTIGGDNASMVTRGLFVLHDLLRGVVKDPPPCVDTTPKETEPGVTQRVMAEQRIASESCGGCHAKFEPLAFGLEKFNGLGTFLERDEHGNSLREDGEILFPGEDQPKKYESAEELMHLLATSPRVQESLTWKVVQFGLGRPLGAGDAAAVQTIHRVAMENGGSYREILRAIAASDLLQTIETEEARNSHD